jgi:hypothetical protein
MSHKQEIAALFRKGRCCKLEKHSTNYSKTSICGSISMRFDTQTLTRKGWFQNSQKRGFSLFPIDCYSERISHFSRSLVVLE